MNMNNSVEIKNKIFSMDRGLIQNAAMQLMPDEDNTYHRNSLDEFLDERRLSNFHFLLPFLSGLGFNSSHLSSGEPMVTGDRNKIITNHKIPKQTKLRNVFQKHPLL